MKFFGYGRYYKNYIYPIIPLIMLVTRSRLSHAWSLYSGSVLSMTVLASRRFKSSDFFNSIARFFSSFCCLWVSKVQMRDKTKKNGSKIKLEFAVKHYKAHTWPAFYLPTGEIHNFCYYIFFCDHGNITKYGTLHKCNFFLF